MTDSIVPHQLESQGGLCGREIRGRGLRDGDIVDVRGEEVRGRPA